MNAATLTNRLANQLQRQELASRAGQTAIAAKYGRYAAETAAELKSIGCADACSTAALIGLSPPMVPPQH